LRAQGDGSVSSEAATEKQIPDPGTVMGTVINPYYSVTKDGQSFLLNMVIDTQPAAPLTVITNWGSGLKR